MSANTDTLDILKALADQTRLDIIRTILNDRDDTASCSKVSECSTLSQPAMSHHFKKLVEADILEEHKVGTEKIYKLNAAVLAKHGIDPHKL